MIHFITDPNSNTTTIKPKDNMIYIGIDFGHGETIASRAPGIGDHMVSQIALTNSNNYNEWRVVSAVGKKDGKWSLVSGKWDRNLADLREGFKSLNMSPRDKESMREFAKLIFERILSDNKLSLEFDPESGHKNFVLGIACPSGWESEIPNAEHTYLEFFRNECGLPVDLCIKESDAAFFSKYKIGEYGPEDTVLVIDLGSSTIDFTTFSNSKCWKEGCGSNTFGAHKIDDILLNAVKTYGNNAQNTKLVNELRGEHGRCDEYISLCVREAKEDFYALSERDPNTKIAKEPTVDFTPLAITYAAMCPKWEGNIFDHAIQYIATNKEYNNLIHNYKSGIKQELENLKKRLDANNIHPNKVLLSGGASSMPFIQQYTLDIFGIRPDVDEQPERVVSDGIALYAKTQRDAWERIKSALEAIDYAEQYIGVEIQTRLEVTNTYLPTFLEEFLGPKDLTGGSMRWAITNQYYSLISNKTYIDLLGQRANRYITSKVASYIHDAIYNEFHIDIDISDVNISVDVSAVRRKLVNLESKVRQILIDATGPHIFTGYDDNRPRPLFERQKVVQLCKERLCIREPFQITYDEEDLNRISTSIRKQCIAEAKRIFYTKQLFETTFKQ